jgi:signal transduction histidine kinase
LAIAKKIVDKHNGRITVKSTPGEGSVFSVVLPVHQSAHSK